MLNYLEPGDHVTVVAPVAVQSGEGVLCGAMFGVASCDAAIGEEVAIAVVGCFLFDKVIGETFALGAPVHFALGVQAATSTATGNTLIGVAIKAAEAGDNTCEVRLHGSWGA
jgi:predicted RecA/RadA family phage recombinase